MESSVLEQATPYIASGVVAVAALLLGRWLERRDNHAAWLRDRRLDAYARFINQAHLAWEEVNAIYVGRLKALATMNEAMHGLGRMEVELKILGPSDVRDAAYDVETACYELGRWAISEEGEAAVQAGVKLNQAPRAQELTSSEERLVSAMTDALMADR